MNQYIVHSECSLGWGGQEIRVLQELIGMQAQGFQTALIAPEKSTIFQRAKSHNIAVFPVNLSSKFNLFAWFDTYRILKRISPAVVNTHSSEDSWIVGAVARFLGKSLVIRTRHVSTPIGSMFSYRFFPHLILTTSKSITKTFVDAGLDTNNVITMPTGIDIDRYSFSAQKRQAIRDDLGLSDEHVLVGNVCVLRSWKGLDFFLDTVALLPEPFRFILIGDGPQRERLEKKADTLNLRSRIIFAGHQEQVERYFCALDILFYTSYASEGVPQSLLQGVCSGLPVVAVKLPSIEETLSGIEKVMWVEYEQTATAAATINNAQRLVNSERDSPPQSWLEKFSLASMLKKIASLYRERLPGL